MPLTAARTADGDAAGTPIRTEVTVVNGWCGAGWREGSERMHGMTMQSGSSKQSASGAPGRVMTKK
jgi:hypothetical protein